MKHSKNNLRLKYLFFFIITTSLCFGIGFLMGAFPKQVKKLQGQSAEPIRILFSDEKLIPRDLFLKFEKFSGVGIEAKVSEGFYFFQSEVNKVDLLFAPLAWWGSLRDSTGSLESFNPYLKNLFPDFQSSKLSSSSFLPLFWSIEKKSLPLNKSKTEPQDELSLFGLFVGNEKTKPHPQIPVLLDYLLQNPERLAHWTRKVEKATTFEIKNLEDSLQPRQIRNYQLLKIKVLDHLESLDQ